MELHEINLGDFDKGYKCSICNQNATHFLISQVNTIRTDAHPVFLCPYHALETSERLMGRCK